MLARPSCNYPTLKYSSTEVGEVEALLLPCLLNRSRRRQYPIYQYARTSTIWPAREDLLEYEKALAVEGALNAIEDNSHPAKTSKPRQSGKPIPAITVISPRVSKAKRVKEIWATHWENWCTMAKTRGRDPPRVCGLERFESGRFDRRRLYSSHRGIGHILTRVMSKGADALACLGEHDMEVDVIEALLAQNRWRRGKRGYDPL